MTIAVTLSIMYVAALVASGVYAYFHPTDLFDYD
jgi:hypothetical protein